MEPYHRRWVLLFYILFSGPSVGFPAGKLLVKVMAGWEGDTNMTQTPAQVIYFWVFLTIHVSIQLHLCHYLICVYLFMMQVMEGQSSLDSKCMFCVVDNALLSFQATSMRSNFFICEMHFLLCIVSGYISYCELPADTQPYLYMVTPVRYLGEFNKMLVGRWHQPPVLSCVSMDCFPPVNVFGHAIYSLHERKQLFYFSSQCFV